jgi:hypothetical protein
VNAVELTGVISGITALVATGLTPLAAKFVKQRQDNRLSMVQVAEMYQKEVVRLQDRADTHDEEIAQLRARHAQEISELKTQHAVALQQVENKWRTVHAEDQTRISQLEHQVGVLYQRLYASDPPQ